MKEQDFKRLSFRNKALGNKTLVLLVLILLLWACREKKAPLRTGSGTAVLGYGSRLDLLENGDLKARVKMDTIKNRSSLYAIGPVSGLKGEITVDNGTSFISTVVKNKPKVTISWDEGAIFLLASSVIEWEKITIDKALHGLTAIENYIKEQLKHTGRDLSLATSFRIEGKVPNLEYHIISKTDSLPHTIKEHHKAKRKFDVQNYEIEVIGFWVSEEWVGRFTHPGKRTHLHFVTKDGATSGHVDNLIVPKGALLFLPKS